MDRDQEDKEKTKEEIKRLRPVLPRGKTRFEMKERRGVERGGTREKASQVHGDREEEENIKKDAKRKEKGRWRRIGYMEKADQMEKDKLKEKTKKKPR